MVVDVFVVDPIKDPFDCGDEEDRYVNYVTNEEYRRDWSVDLDDEGWIWLEDKRSTND